VDWYPFCTTTSKGTLINDGEVVNKSTYKTVTNSCLALAVIAAAFGSKFPGGDVFALVVTAVAVSTAVAIYSWNRVLANRACMAAAAVPVDHDEEVESQHPTVSTNADQLVFPFVNRNEYAFGTAFDRFVDLETRQGTARAFVTEFDEVLHYAFPSRKERSSLIFQVSHDGTVEIRYASTSRHHKAAVPYETGGDVDDEWVWEGLGGLESFQPA
jgi:hypothetical protein